MRVLVLADGFHRTHTGGVVNALRSELPALAARGHEVVIAARRLGRSEPATEDWNGIAIHRFPAPPPGSRAYLVAPAATLARLPGLVRRLHAEQAFDRAYVHAAAPGLALARARLRLPVLYCFHGPMAAEMRVDRAAGRYGKADPLYRLAGAVAHRLERAALDRADIVLTRSAAMESELRAEHPGFKRPAARLPLGVDVARFADGPGHAAARNRLGLEGPTVLCVRRLVARMGLDLLVDAFATVLRRHPGAVLAIAGRGYQRAALERRARRLGIARAVRFVGFVPDAELPLWFRAADLFVLPSVSLEGFGMVTLEALAAGTPVLATPVGASPEVLGRLGSRHLATAATAGALASAVDAWLSAPATAADRERFAAYARTEFGSAAVAERLEGLLAEAHRR